MHRNRGMKRSDSSDQGLDDMDHRQRSSRFRRNSRSENNDTENSRSLSPHESDDFGIDSSANASKSRSLSPQRHHRSSGDLSATESERDRRSFLSNRRSASERHLLSSSKQEMDRDSPSPQQQRRHSGNNRNNPSSEGSRPSLVGSQRSMSERDLGSRKKQHSSQDSQSEHSDEWGSFGSFHLKPLRTMEEQDLFEQKLLNDLSSGRPSGGDAEDAEDESTASEEGEGESSCNSFESFAAAPEPLHSTPQRQNKEDSNSLCNFFNRVNPVPEEMFSEDEEEGSIFSMSIMSLNTAPFAILEEEEGEEECTTVMPRMRAKFAVMTTEEAFDALVEEYAKLMDNVEVAEVMLDQRKMEKTQLSGLVQSREEEYVIRRDCIAKLQATAEALEEELMIEREKDQLVSKANKWTSRQKDAWEKLDKAVTKLDELRDENKKLISKLMERPEISDEEVLEQMKLNKRRKKVKALEEERAKLSAEVNLLRGKKKASSFSPPPLIGLEIVVDEAEDEESLTSTDLLSR